MVDTNSTSPAFSGLSSRCNARFLPITPTACKVIDYLRGEAGSIADGSLSLMCLLLSSQGKSCFLKRLYTPKTCVCTTPLFCSSPMCKPGTFWLDVLCSPLLFMHLYQTVSYLGSWLRSTAPEVTPVLHSSQK